MFGYQHDLRYDWYRDFGCLRELHALKERMVNVFIEQWL